MEFHFIPSTWYKYSLFTLFIPSIAVSSHETGLGGIGVIVAIVVHQKHVHVSLGFQDQWRFGISDEKTTKGYECAVD
jgi:hypothetical protein